MRPMRPLDLVCALLLGTLATWAFAGAPATLDPETGIPQSWPDPGQMTFDTVSFEAPAPSRHTLDNGMVVYLLEDRELPLISGAAYLKMGSFYDPEAKISLAALTADLMRTGGSAGRSADQIDTRLENLAASIEVSASDLFTEASVSSLSENIEEVLEILSGVLREPTFAPNRIDLAKGRAIESIRRENDDPVTIAVREFYRRLAAGHPAGYIATEQTVSAVTRQDLAAFHARYAKPNNAVIALAGDFETQAMLARLETIFGDWSPGEVSFPDLPPYNPDPPAKVFHAQKELGQSIILMGHPSLYAYGEDYAPFTVANDVLGGGGFSSRIFTEVRTRRGLAYSAGSQLSQGFETPGTFLLYAFTRTDATAQVIELLQAQVQAMIERPVSEAELEVQKSNILSGAVFRFTDAAAIVTRTARAVEILGLSADYFERYVEEVSSVTPEVVQRVAKEDFRPQDLLLMVVGDSSGFDKPLSSFGEVEEVSLP